MKKFALLAAAAVLSSSVAFAQTSPSQSHDVEIKIPTVLRIRMTEGNSNAAVANPSAVAFDLSNAPAFELGGIYDPTNVGAANWDDVKVFANAKNGWEVKVETDNTDFAWDKVKVLEDANDITSAPRFDLGTNDAVIASDTVKTNGWKSLAFGPQNFIILLEGTEEAGDYSTTVTYTLFGL